MNIRKLFVLLSLAQLFNPIYSAEKNKHHKPILKQKKSEEDADLLKQLATLVEMRVKEQMILCCNQSFTIKELSSHYSINHFVNGYECADCKKQFSTAVNAAYHHAAIHEKTTIYSCPRCNHNYQNENSLKKHYINCINCGKRRNHSSKREEAYLHLHKNIAMIPELTDYKLTWGSLLGYVVQDQGNGNYYCMARACHQLYDKKSQAASCYLKHFNNAIFSCPSCMRAMNDMDSYMNHVTCKCTHNYSAQAKKIIKKYGLPSNNNK